jgi:hypothetical protein
MSASAHVIFGILIFLGYLVAPVMLVWGWAWWGAQPKLKTIPSALSLIGFVFATVSAALAVSSAVYAQIHGFPYYDPLLLRIFRWGLLLSLAGILFSIAGVWRKNSLRWHAPVCALGTLAFWIVAASGE